MEFLFPVSGVTTNILLPPLVALVISFFCSMAGVSGAFLLLPFQLSFLNYTSPSVSATNHVFNVIAIPSGVYRYIREGRMVWPLTLIIAAGTLPGVFLGYYLRVHWLPDPGVFKLFVGCVLLYVGLRLMKDLLRQGSSKDATAVSPLPEQDVIGSTTLGFSKIVYGFRGEHFSFSPPAMFAMTLVVGIIGGAYGIGGGAIIAPFTVAVFRLPVYTVAGPALMGTFITSVAGALFYSAMSTPAIPTSPDWLLGSLFGLGGLVGMYLGAKAQRYVPPSAIKAGLSLVVVLLAARYVFDFFSSAR